MPNPTRQEIIDAKLARQWAEWNKSCEVSSPEIQAAANFILAHTTPPTMAEVKWDDEKHCLREAEHPEYGKVIMLSHIDYCNQIAVLWSGSRKFIDLCVVPAHLTPTGKRYALTEVQE